MNTSNMITHYTILFSMYLGMELQKSQALFDQITGDDPELIDSAMTDWRPNLSERVWMTLLRSLIRSSRSTSTPTIPKRIAMSMS